MEKTETLARGPVALRPVTPKDAALYARWMHDPFVTRNYGGADVDFTEEMARGFFTGRQGRPSFLILQGADGPPVGFCELSGINRAARSATLGIFIGEAACRGRGLGRAALDALLGYGFGPLGLNSVWLDTWEGNTAALALYRGAGFRQIGRRRQAWPLDGRLYDLVYMDLLAQEYTPAQNAPGKEAQPCHFGKM